MNFRMLTTAACFVSLGAAAVAGGCAAESTTPSGNNNNAAGNVTSNTVGGPVGPTSGGVGTSGGPVTSNVVTNNVVTNNVVTSNVVGGATSNTVGGVTGAAVTSAGVTSAGVTSAGVTTGASTTGGGAACMAPPATGTTPLIDDLGDDEHTILPNEGRKGYWYQFNDMTASGVQTSTPLDGAPGTGGVFTSTASGFTEWGAGFGVSLNNDDSTGKPCPYNASVHTGVQFNITSDVAMTFKISMPTTEADSAHFETTIPAGQAGAVYQVPFSSLALPDWATSGATWDASQILALQWQAGASVAFNVTIDNVAFY